MFFERIYFSRGSDAEIYQERKNLEINFTSCFKCNRSRHRQHVFSYIPNTAETFYGLVEAAQDFLNQRKTITFEK
jgi:amidophosphoribosyltransferase